MKLDPTIAHGLSCFFFLSLNELFGLTWNINVTKINYQTKVNRKIQLRDQNIILAYFLILTFLTYLPVDLHKIQCGLDELQSIEESVSEKVY